MMMMLLMADEMTRRLGGRVLLLSEIVLEADDQSGVTASARRAQRDSWNKIDETGSRMSDPISRRQFLVAATAAGGCRPSSSAVISGSRFLTIASG
jgi:hypothetical protein